MNLHHPRMFCDKFDKIGQVDLEMKIFIFIYLLSLLRVIVPSMAFVKIITTPNLAFYKHIIINFLYVCQIHVIC